LPCAEPKVRIQLPPAKSLDLLFRAAAETLLTIAADPFRELK
jgi:hypothetical protein